MKINKKSLLSLALAGMLVLSACSGASSAGSADEESASATQNSPEVSASDSPEEVTDITVWTKDRHDQEHMTAMFERFNAENPDINVIYEMYTDNYQQTVEIAHSTGELPDILVLVQPVINSLLARDAVTYIDGYLTPEYLARFDEDLFIEGVNMRDGQIFTLPSTGNTLRLVYNKDIFEQVGLAGPPTSLAELVDYSKLITDQLSSDGVYGFALPMKNPTSGLQRGFSAIPNLSGYPVIEGGFDFAQGQYDFSCYKPVVEAFTEIWSSGAAFPGCESLEIDPLRTQFANGKIGMYMTYSHSEWGVYTDQFPTEYDWDYAQLPSIDGTITGTQKVGAGFWYCMTANCKDPDKGWRVLEAIYDHDNLVSYYEQGLGVTVVTSVKEAAKTPESIEKVPYMGLHEYDKIWPIPPTSVSAEGDDWGKVFGDVIFGGRSDIDAAIADLNARYNAAYEKSIADGNDVPIHYPNFKAADPSGTMN